MEPFDRNYDEKYTLTVERQVDEIRAIAGETIRRFEDRHTAGR